MKGSSNGVESFQINEENMPGAHPTHKTLKVSQEFFGSPWESIYHAIHVT